MARSRNIKPGFFANELLCQLEPLARLLFAGLWTMADREGRLEDRPERIKVQILPYDRCRPEKLLQMLHDAEFILRYEVKGRPYIWIRKFRKHQNPHTKEVASTIPGPTGIVESPENDGYGPKNSGLSPADSLSSDSSPLIPDTPAPAEPISVSDSISTSFDPDRAWQRFISDWPNQVNLDNARRVWKRIFSEAVDPQGLESQVFLGKAKYQSSGQWARGAFDAPDKWLEKRKWLDNPAPTATSGEADVWGDLARES